MTKKQNEGWDGISKEDSSRKPITSNKVSGIGSPITAWAVEIEGKIDPSDVYHTRATARYVRNAKASVGLYKRIHVRKVQLVPVKER